MGAQESTLKPEGGDGMAAEPVGPAPAAPPEPREVPEAAPSSSSHPTSHSATLGRSASGHAALNELGKQSGMQQPHRRHHTWHHAQRKRAYDQTIWDIQGGHNMQRVGSRGGMWESDSESDLSEMSAPSVKRQSTVPSEAGATHPH